MLGRNNSDNSNCITYSPAVYGTSGQQLNATAWVSAGQTAETAHGYQGSTCDPDSGERQSALTFTPANISEISVTTPSSLGTITHNNFPVSIVDQYFTGNLEVRILGQVFTFPWEMNETPNRPQNVDDVTRITAQSPETEVVIDGLPYRMMITGFAPAGTSCTDPAAENSWKTPEGQASGADLCVKFAQVRTLEIEKTVELPEGYTGEVPESFAFTATTSGVGLEGVETFWDGGFALGDGDSTDAQDVLVPNQVVTVTEDAVEGWELKSITCEGKNIDVNVEERSVTFSASEVDSVADLAASCTFVNAPTVDETETPEPTEEPTVEPTETVTETPTATETGVATDDSSTETATPTAGGNTGNSGGQLASTGAQGAPLLFGGAALAMLIGASLLFRKRREA